MILLTGYQGFIGSHFRKALGEEGQHKVIGIDQDNAWEFLRKFDQWKNVTLIVHNGAISSTTEKNWMTIAHYNQDFTAHLFAKAMEYEIPIKYASSAMFKSVSISFRTSINFCSDLLIYPSKNFSA